MSHHPRCDPRPFPRTPKRTSIPSVFSQLTGRVECYTSSVTEADVISHWRKGARDAMIVAQAAQEKGKYALALFNAHLAVEKALKALYMEQHRKESPMTHDLEKIALQINRKWTPAQKELLTDLTQYAVAARYDDPYWAEREATEENTSEWLVQAEVFLTILLP